MSTEEEYQELKKLADKTGIADVMKAYNQYYKLTQASYDAINNTNLEIACVTTTST